MKWCSKNYSNTVKSNTTSLELGSTFFKRCKPGSAVPNCTSRWCVISSTDVATMWFVYSIHKKRVGCQWWLQLQNGESRPLVGCFGIKALGFEPWRIIKSLQNVEHHQNIIITSVAHCQHVLKISLKSVQNFPSCFANSWTDIHITPLVEVKIPSLLFFLLPLLTQPSGRP